MSMRNRVIVLSICFLMVTSSVRAKNISDAHEWGRYFQEAKTQGTFVVYDYGHDRWRIFNKERAETRYVPASTFKIPNTLIALETKVVKNTEEIFPWDGVTYDYKDWNRGHTLATAMKYSAVPVYQRFARAIGFERMKELLMRFDYGNNDVSGKIDRFWIDGPLAISAVEQVKFLIKLYKGVLPASRKNQGIVKGILVNEATIEYVLRAKTGMASKIGWWVGWIEKGDNVYFFACNLDLVQERSAADWIAISKQILKAEKILP